jgi:sulfotransferase
MFNYGSGGSDNNGNSNNSYKIPKRYFFISGLPRSGSTLLSAILRQNPAFYADVSSPLHTIITSSMQIISTCEAGSQITVQQRIDICRSIFDGYFRHLPNNVNTVFDTSRQWTANTALLRNLFPTTKIIACVRDVRWILDSLELIANKNPFHHNGLVDQESNGCVETRCAHYMDVSKGGMIIKPYMWLKDGLAVNPSMFYLMEYDELTRHPEKTMKSIYEFIKEPYFDHDFNNVEYSNESYDTACSMPDLHTVKKRVQYKPRITILPKDVWAKYDNLSFWRNDDDDDDGNNKNKDKAQTLSDTSGLLGNYS